MNEAPEQTNLAVGRFELLRRLQMDGGFQQWLARDPATDATVEVSLSPALDSNPMDTAGFTPFGCPEVLPMLDQGLDCGSQFVVTPHLEGFVPLSEYCKTDRLMHESAIVTLVSRIATALNDLHRRHRGHGALTPGSILIRSGQRPGHWPPESDDYLRIRFAEGGMDSGPYRAPVHEGETLSAQAQDLFALSVIMFQLTAGRLPSRQLGTMRSGAAQKWPSVRLFRHGISPLFERLIQKALAVKLKSRYRSFVEFVGDLTLVAESASGTDLGISRQGIFIAARSLECFANLADQELWEIVNPSRWIVFQADTLIPGTPTEADSVYAIVSGGVTQFDGGRIVANLGPGACFGAHRLVQQESANLSSYAAAGTTLLSIPAAAVDQMTTSCQLGLHRHLLKQLSMRLRKVTSKAVAADR